MTTTIDSPTIEEKLDALAVQVDAIAAELEIARKRRESMDELREALVPVAGEAFGSRRASSRHSATTSSSSSRPSGR